VPAHGHGNRPTLVDGFHPAHHAFGGFHRDAADAAFSQVLLHFENDLDGIGDVEAVADDLESLVNWRKMPLFKLHIDGGAGDLDYVSYVLGHISF